MLSDNILQRLIKINHKKQIIPDKELFIEEIIIRLENTKLPNPESILFKSLAICYNIFSRPYDVKYKEKN